MQTQAPRPLQRSRVHRLPKVRHLHRLQRPLNLRAASHSARARHDSGSTFELRAGAASDSNCTPQTDGGPAGGSAGGSTGGSHGGDRPDSRCDRPDDHGPSEEEEGGCSAAFVLPATQCDELMADQMEEAELQEVRRDLFSGVTDSPSGTTAAAAIPAAPDATTTPPFPSEPPVAPDGPRRSGRVPSTLDPTPAYRPEWCQYDMARARRRRRRTRLKRRRARRRRRRTRGTPSCLTGARRASSARRPGVRLRSANPEGRGRTRHPMSNEWTCRSIYGVCGDTGRP